MAASASSSPRTLIACSDRLVACDLRATLERLGHAVSGPAVSAEAALALAAKRPPDVALVDLRLSGETGSIELALALGQRFGVPVVFLTGRMNDEDFERARSARPAGYVKRPFSDGELAAVLAAAIDHGASDSGKDSYKTAAIVPNPDDPPSRGPALARATELSRRPSFRKLLGPRASGFPAPRDAFIPSADTGKTFFDEVGETSRVAPVAEERSADEAGDDPISPLDAIGDPLLTLAPDWRITGANSAALAYFGGATPLIGRDFWSNFSPEIRDACLPEFQRARGPGGRHTFEIHDAERGCWLDTLAYHLPAGAGSQPGLLALFRDITDRKRSESDGIRQQRLEGLGLLARGFAHDFNNLLTVLVGSLDLATERYPEDEEFQREMADAGHAANDARDLVQQLMTFAQGGRPIREETRLGEMIREIFEECRTAHPSIRYQFQSGDPGLVARVDRRQIRRLIENLVTNAEQAMPDGGALIARCQRLSSDEVGRFRGEPAASPLDHVVIEIIDTGRGMTEEELGHAFQPYFTTRAGVNATGIGLTVCESIAKAHDGFILLQSKEGRGTIATLCLPILTPERPSDQVAGNVFMPRQAEGSAAKSEPETGNQGDLSGPDETEPQVEVLSPGGRILILEDDRLIRRLIAVTLRREGHEVVETADGNETIRVYREALEQGRPFDLVLSDLTIEHGLGGVETMRLLREMDPDVLAIVSSGYSDAPAMARPEAFGFSAVLPKPYPPRELRCLVAEMLKRRNRGRPVFPA